MGDVLVARIEADCSTSGLDTSEGAVPTAEPGRKHFNALLPPPVRRALQIRDPVRDIFKQIATRAGQLVG